VLSALKALSVASNQIRSLPDQLGGCSNLESLDLAGNRDLEQLPEGLGRLGKLKSLNADDTGLAGVPPALLKGCAALQTLSLHG